MWVATQSLPTVAGWAALQSVGNAHVMPRTWPCATATSRARKTRRFQSYGSFGQQYRCRIFDGAALEWVASGLITRISSSSTRRGFSVLITAFKGHVKWDAPQDPARHSLSLFAGSHPPRAKADKRGIAHFIEVSCTFRSVQYGPPKAQLTTQHVSLRVRHPVCSRHVRCGSRRTSTCRTDVPVRTVRSRIDHDLRAARDYMNRR